MFWMIKPRHSQPMIALHFWFFLIDMTERCFRISIPCSVRFSSVQLSTFDILKGLRWPDRTLTFWQGAVYHPWELLALLLMLWAGWLWKKTNWYVMTPDQAWIWAGGEINNITIFHLQSVSGLTQRGDRARAVHLWSASAGEDYSCAVMSQWQPMMWVSVINQVPIIVYLGSDKAEIDHFTW